MPTCPGCKSRLPHDELMVHRRFCKWVWSERPQQESRLTEHIAAYMHDRQRQLSDF
jgi:hypothetical protein